MSRRAESEAPRIEPFRFAEPGGAIAVTEFRGPGQGSGNHVLLVPPFAEEMNKSRRMLALIGRMLASRGLTAWLVDLYGTGESDGDFEDARLERWQSDLRACVRRIESAGGQVTALLGVRTGALLAMDLAADVATARQLLLWQPVLKGADALTEMLRLRVAASRMTPGARGESVTELRAMLGAGQSVEVAGYSIHPELAAALDPWSVGSLRGLPGRRIDWFQLASASLPLPPPVQAAIDGLVDGGAEVQLTSVEGDRFWNAAEITVVEELLQRTAAVAA